MTETSAPVIPAERAGHCPASESRNPVIKAVRGFTPAVDYWVPARASPVEPGSLGRDDGPYAIALLKGKVWSFRPATGGLPRRCRAEKSTTQILHILLRLRACEAEH